MNTDTSTRLIDAEPAMVRAILLQPLRLPEWNPAFVELRGPHDAEENRSYELTGIRGLRGTFRYSSIRPDFIQMDWTVPGMHETSAWELVPNGRGTTVIHTVGRSGPLALLLAHALSGLAQLRLERLAHVARTAQSLFG